MLRIINTEKGQTYYYDQKSKIQVWPKPVKKKPKKGKTVFFPDRKC